MYDQRIWKDFCLSFPQTERKKKKNKNKSISLNLKKKILNIEGVETKNRDYNKDEFKLASLKVFKFMIRMINSLEIGVNIDIK